MIDLQIKNAVAWIKLNRPDKKNALSVSFLQQIADQLESNDKNEVIKVSVLYAEKDFSSGGDLNDMLSKGNDNPMLLAEEVQQLYQRIAEIEKPLITYATGIVFGGGFELALVSDIIIANEKATFALPEARFGIVPGGGATQRLKARIGRQNASFVLMTGQVFNAEQMYKLGVIQKLTISKQEVETIAVQIASNDISALKSMKILLKKNHDFNAESEEFAKLITKGGIQKIQSFLKK
ncbi:MAG: enoyl-CoA hydratase/isomerase family protein [Bacteroidales bacterium]|nr:enoyl-CoA hydratase/isomerase family protein [Bacteroidales bacterium]